MLYDMARLRDMYKLSVEYITHCGNTHTVTELGNTLKYSLSISNLGT